MQEVLLERIKTIPGWMTEKELKYLHRLVESAGPNAIIVELGTWLGRSTAALYSAIHDMQKVITIDTWLGQSDLRYTAHKEILEYDIFLRFLELMKTFNIEPEWYNGHSTGACYLRMLSVDASKLFANKMVDILFIDCDHTKLGEDIDTWYRKVKTDGIICGHDYSWPGVKEQLIDRLKVINMVDDLWVGKKE